LSVWVLSKFRRGRFAPCPSGKNEVEVSIATDQGVSISVCIPFGERKGKEEKPRRGPAIGFADLSPQFQLEDQLPSGEGRQRFFQGGHAHALGRKRGLSGRLHPPLMGRRKGRGGMDVAKMSLENDRRTLSGNRVLWRETRQVSLGVG